MESLRRHDLTIGPRYHGTALALQAERMGVCVTFDSRTEEMCAQTGVPFLRAKDLADKPLTRATLKNLIAFDPEAYDAQRAERAGAYVAFLEANGLEAKDYLKKIAAGPARPAPTPPTGDAPRPSSAGGSAP
jgi:polysaccharide pyruvyl transferase WcaK-like protein